MSQELLGLHNLKANPKARKKKIRRGRGNSSGHGNYSGRGMKGQKSRSGASGLKLRGLKSYLLRIPKNKGFKSARANNVPINLSILDKYFEDKEVVSLKSLVKKNLIPKSERKVKILADGVLTKKLVIKIDSLSLKAKEAIIKVGGEIIEPSPVKKVNLTKEKKITKKETVEVKSEKKEVVKPKVPAKEKAKEVKVKKVKDK